MSKCVIFLAHPNLEASKLNKGLLAEVSKYPEIIVKDLYKSYGELTFNSKIDAKEDQKLIENAERIILQFPFYWYSSTPLLKKWLDDVLSYGWAYATEKPKTEGKKLLISITTGGKDTDYKPNGYNNYYVNEFITPFVQTAKLCKMEFAGAFFTQGANVITGDEISKKAKEYIKFIKGE